MNIVITGGSRGLGKSIIQRLHKTHTCIAIARASVELERVGEEYGCATYACDVTKGADITRTIEEIAQTYGSLMCSSIPPVFGSKVR